MKRIILVTGIFLAVGVVVFLIARPKQAQTSSNSLRLSPSTQNRITIGGKSLDSIEMSNSENIDLYKPRMNEILASKVSLRQISYIRRSANQRVLVFKDGSEMFVTNYVKEQLSDEILFRLELGSERMASSRHGN